MSSLFSDTKDVSPQNLRRLIIVFQRYNFLNKIGQVNQRRIEIYLTRFILLLFYFTRYRQLTVHDQKLFWIPKGLKSIVLKNNMNFRILSLAFFFYTPCTGCIEKVPHTEMKLLSDLQSNQVEVFKLRSRFRFTASAGLA